MSVLKCLNYTWKASSHFHIFKQKSYQEQAFRCLFSKSNLGVDGYIKHRDRTKVQLSDIEDKFRLKMKEYMEDTSRNIIFTEDLKNMIHISESTDLELVTNMMKKFNQQNKQLRFGNFVFGPVVMRMFHYLNKPDEALECFKSPELDGFFDQLITYQILLDLMYENKKYEEILKTFGILQNRQIEGNKYPRNIVVLTLAACYKLNSQDSFKFATNLWSELTEVGHKPSRRAATFCAGLALNQDKPAIVLEILSCVRNQNYTTVRNLKIAAFLKLGRVEDVIPLLKDVLNQDQIHTFNRDVIENVRLQIEKDGNVDIKAEFTQIMKYLNAQGHISEQSLDEQLCSEIVIPQFLLQNTSNQSRMNRSKTRSYPTRQRSGLHDMY